VVATLTPSQVAINPALFSSTFLKILDKKKKLVPMRWNKMQRHFHAHRTGRDLILKARQLGSSTYVQGEMFRRTVTETRTTITLAHDADTTAAMRIMADRFWEHCRFNDIQPARKYANASMTTYPEFDSTAVIATAGNVETGRGNTYTDFHGSEVAFWKDAEKIVAGAMQGGDPDVILESTPNGAQGYFYELCMEALSGDSVWTLHFYPWWWDEAYQLPLDKGEKLTYTEEETKLVNKHSLTPEQIKWRRRKQKELKHKFKQEYPEDPTACFLTSGNSYFKDNEGSIDYIFEAPMEVVYNPDHEYVAGLDFGQTNDFTAMPVLDKDVKKQVDLLHVNKLEWKEIRKRIRNTLFDKWSHLRCANGHFKIGIWDAENKKIYEKCPVCGGQITEIKKPKLGAETNNVGSVNIELLRADGIEVLEFTTNNATKADAASTMYDAFDTGGWRMQDYPVQRHEYSIFVSVQLPSGVWRLAAEGDGHDDTVIGGMIALWAAITPIQIF
jgi:hypothetical protein